LARFFVLGCGRAAVLLHPEGHRGAHRSVCTHWAELIMVSRIQYSCSFSKAPLPVQRNCGDSSAPKQRGPQNDTEASAKRVILGSPDPIGTAKDLPSA
jgi:hypothetical protein